MKHWTQRRKISFWVHAAFASVPFSISTVSALVLWASLLGKDGAPNYWLAVPAVAVVEVLSLTGLVLYIAKVPSRFMHGLRHALPFISAIPLAWELFQKLQHNTLWVSIPATAIAAVVLVYVSYQCFKTIEELFVNPAQAAVEEAKEKWEDLDAMLGGLQQQIVLVSQRANGLHETLRVVTQPQLQITAPTETRIYSAVASQEAPQRTEDGTPLLRDDAPVIAPENGAQRASKSTMIREYKAQGLKVAEIIERHPDWDKNSVAPIWSRA